MRDSSLPPTDDPDPEKPADPTRRLRPLAPAPLAVSAIAGLVGGWLLHPLAERIWSTAPTVSWTQAVVLWFAVAILGFLAWSTRRDLHATPRTLAPHHALNRLVLAWACALVGALLAGGYLGYAVSWIGDSAELAEQRMVRSLVASAGGTAMLVTAKLLERACRAGDGRKDA